MLFGFSIRNASLQVERLTLGAFKGQALFFKGFDHTQINPAIANTTAMTPLKPARSPAGMNF